jgi:DNA-binding CsgD family transcriptional regulator
MLTAREHDVMHWVAEGKSNGDIGRILGCTECTVKKHLQHIFPKLGVETRTAAAIAYLQGSAWVGEHVVERLMCGTKVRYPDRPAFHIVSRIVSAHIESHAPAKTHCRDATKQAPAWLRGVVILTSRAK